MARKTIASQDLVIAQLRACGVNWPAIAPISAVELPLAGQTYVLTGTFQTLSREEAKEKLERSGAKVASSVSKKTTAVSAQMFNCYLRSCRALSDYLFFAL